MEFPKKIAQKNYRTISASEKRKSWTERTHLLKAEKSLFRSLRGPTDSTEETLSSSDSSGRMINSSHISMVSDGGTASPSSTGKSKRTLGTFDGVFAPVSLSMLRCQFHQHFSRFFFRAKVFFWLMKFHQHSMYSFYTRRS